MTREGSMLQANDVPNAEGYCRVCRQPLGISGLCYPCMLNDDINNDTNEGFKRRREALDKIIASLNKTDEDSDA